jgi:triosephosphate isomerase
MRRPIIIGNWKMNNNVSDSIRLITELKGLLSGKQDAEIAIAPAMVSLHPSDIALAETSIGLAAQNVHFEENGAFTGEVSASMLLDLNCKYVIVGHSERRQYFSETDEIINKKVKTVLEHEMSPILCVGENLQQREEGKALAVVEDQLRICLRGINDDQATRVVIAYEPIWAIGTGVPATPEAAQEIHQCIRGILENTYSKNVATVMRTVYGGSVTPKNIGLLMKQQDIDGALVGGASLDAQAFVDIIQYGE